MSSPRLFREGFRATGPPPRPQRPSGPGSAHFPCPRGREPRSGSRVETSCSSEQTLVHIATVLAQRELEGGKIHNMSTSGGLIRVGLGSSWIPGLFVRIETEKKGLDALRRI